MDIGRFERPKTLEEAHALIVEKRGLPIGGGAWIHMIAKAAELAVDLSGLGLDYIRDRGDSVEIGAMATARGLEISPVLSAGFGSLFRNATEHLVGVQLRNVITVGGTVAGKYGFSDLNTVLAALDASLVLYGDKTVDIMSFLTGPREGPFLLEKIIVGKGARASYQSVRVTRNEFAILNACAAFSKEAWRVAVGARPAAARLSLEAARVLGSEGAPSAAVAGRAGDAAAAELAFGDDTRGSSEYRRAICSVLVRRAILEAAR